MKNRFTWLLAGLLMLGISACGSGGDEDVSYDEAADTAAEVVDEAADEAEAVADDAMEDAEAAMEDAEAAADEMADDAEEAMEDAEEAAEEMADDAAEAVMVKDDYVATDAATVALGDGQPKMVKFYADW